MAYYVQSAKYKKNNNRFYGVEDAHNHNTQTKFSQAARAYMENHYNVASSEIELGDVRRNQSRRPTGAGVVQLRFVRDNWTA
jgi:hypothetical protein